MIKKVLSAALLCGFGVAGSPVAQELPICTHQYHDADGDGFGWQNEATCLITSSSEPPPDYTNKSTGEPVTLTRPYWDGNTDIANRSIRCDRYDYQQASGEYQRPVDPATFNALPDNTDSPKYYNIAQVQPVCGAGSGSGILRMVCCESRRCS